MFRRRCQRRFVPPSAAAFFANLRPDPTGIRFVDDAAPRPTPTAPPTGPPPGPAAAGPFSPSPSSQPAPRRRREFPVGLMAFLAVFGGGAAYYRHHPMPRPGVEEELHRSFAVEGAAKVVVDVLGPIEVTRGEPGRVDCRVTRRTTGRDQPDAEADLGNLDVSMRRDEAGAVLVTARRVAGAPRLDAAVSARIAVPEGASVRLRTHNGALKVVGVEGPVDARTGNGPIEVRSAAGRIQVASGNGPVRVEAADAVVTAAVSNGPIDFRGSFGDGPSSFDSRNGRVTLRIPGSQEFRIDALAANGRVSSDFDFDPSERRPAKRRGRSLFGAVGHEPKADVKVRAGNGSIRVVESDD